YVCLMQDMHQSLSPTRRSSDLIPKATMRLLRKAELSWEMAPLGACVGLELGRVALVLATKPKWLFAVDSHWDWWLEAHTRTQWGDRKSTRLNSSHGSISYAVFC